MNNIINLRDFLRQAIFEGTKELPAEAKAHGAVLLRNLVMEEITIENSESLAPTATHLKLRKGVNYE